MTRHISIDTIREAATHVYEAATRTPLVPLPTEPGHPDVFLKLETLQPIGSFKIRGAYNAVRQLTPAELARGVWTVSAGNAAQGVALAARKVGARSSVLVMDTAPDTKLRAIERFGATIVQAPYDECWRTVEAHRSDRMQGHFVHPFDDDHFISGNGTIGLEILEDLPDVDAVVAPLGGGGLLAGVACVLRSERPEASDLRGRTGNRRAAVGLLRRGTREHVRRLARVVRRRGRRTLGPRVDVAASPGLGVGVARRLARRRRTRDATRGGTHPRHRRRSGRVCRCGSRLTRDGRARSQEGRRRRLGRQHRPEEVRRARRRVWIDAWLPLVPHGLA